MRTSCLHIGLVKTGTTTLQKQVFANHREIAFLGLFGHMYKDTRLHELSDLIRRSPPAEYDPTLSQRLFREATASCIESDRVTVLSDEMLTSRTYREKAAVYTIDAVDSDTVARRLGDLFAGWKIMITIRSQPKLLWSWYLHDCRNTIVQPDAWLQNHFSRGDSGRLGALKYFELAELYKSVFGSENIGIFTLEQMIRARQEFAKDLASFLGIDADETTSLLENAHENVRVSRRMMMYQRFRHIVFPSADLHRFLPASIRNAGYHFLRRGEPTNISMPGDWAQTINDFYAESNRRLSKSYGLPLLELGYPM